MKSIVFTFSLLLVFLNSYSQSQYLMNIATPNMSELGKYGQIPVSYFSGLPNISIPLYTIECKDIKLPISLTYYAGGNKTETHPTWVGLGWNLNAGGSITRIINGTRDELIDDDWSSETHSNYSHNCETGYYYRANELNNTWADSIFLDKLVNGSNICMTDLDTQPDEFCFNFSGYSGSFYFVEENGNLITKVKSKDNIFIKIESVFSVGEIEFDVYRSNDDISNMPPEEDVKAIAYKTFLKFILTDKNGTKYEFGGDTSCIDFSTANGITVATSWHLSKISSQTGESFINLKYNGAGVILNKSKSNYFYADYIEGGSGFLHLSRNDDASGFGGLAMSAIHPKYLDEITTSENQVINFISSRSIELDYSDWDSDEYNTSQVFKSIFTNSHANAFEVIWKSKYLKSHYFMQLDTIRINTLKRIAFQYSDSETQRLRLNRLSIFPFYDDDAYPPGQQFALKYDFEYNPQFLPIYNSRKSDNWGFYNNIDYSIVQIGNYGELMYDTRVPDAGFMKAEVLEKIHYPTGGTTIFEYEPHDYSKIVVGYKVNDTVFKLINQVGIAGGLRIKTMTSYADNSDHNKFTKKSFFYSNQDDSSSGILSGIPQYHSEGKHHIEYKYSNWSGLCHFKYEGNYDLLYFQDSQHLILPLSDTYGNHITYSRVIEKNEDNSSTIYNYTNHEQFPDESPVKVLTNIDGDEIFGEFTSREIERGLLRCEEIRDNFDKLVSKTDYIYNQDPNRYNDFVKKVDRYNFFGSSIRLSANKIYSFTPYLVKKIDSIYSTNVAQNTIIRTEEKYKYDEYKNIVERAIACSDGDTIITTYKYPYNSINNEPYSFMVAAHILSPIIEQTSERHNLNGIVAPIESIYTVYYFFRTYQSAPHN